MRKFLLAGAALQVLFAPGSSNNNPVYTQPSFSYQTQQYHQQQLQNFQSQQNNNAAEQRQQSWYGVRQ